MFCQKLCPKWEKKNRAGVCHYIFTSFILWFSAVAAVMLVAMMTMTAVMRCSKQHGAAHAKDGATGKHTVMMVDVEPEWEQWKKEFGKTYSPRQEQVRRAIFCQNLQDIRSHNALYPAVHSYTLGLNQFSDMTMEEYLSYNLLQQQPPPQLLTSSTTNMTHHHHHHVCIKGNHSSSSDPSGTTPSSLPPSLDWRTLGYVTEVKEQGHCGSCWAFSTTGAVEGQHFKKTGTLLSLSEQQLVDCSTAEGNKGCDGGLQEKAFHYIMTQPGGLETEQDYPYVAQDQSCQVNASEEAAKVSGCVDVESGSEEALKHAVATVGPISVGIDASHHSFKHYKSGVYTNDNCRTHRLSHAVLVVGYGAENSRDYWLVKNSWGTKWGEEGYIKMARNHNNMCGIATDASYPIV